MPDEPRLHNKSTLELAKRDAWAATRFGCVARKYKDAPRYTRVVRFRLRDVQTGTISLMERFLNEQEIPYVALEEDAARFPPRAQESRGREA